MQSKAASRGVLEKMLFLKISQYLQKNTFVGVSATLLKRDSDTAVFLRILRNF